MSRLKKSIITLMNLRKNLEYYLKESGITASALARKCGLPKTTIANWIAGAPPKDISQVKKLCDTLGTSIDQLVFGDLSAGQKAQSFSPENPFVFEGDFRIKIERISKK